MPAYSGNRIDTDLIPSNIRNGVDIYGVVGNYTTPSGLPFTGLGATNSVVISHTLGFTGATHPSPGQIGTYDFGGFWWYISFFTGGGAGAPSFVQIYRANKTTGAFTLYQSPGVTSVSGGGSTGTANYYGGHDLGGGVLLFRIGAGSQCGSSTFDNQKLSFNLNTQTFSLYGLCASNADPDFTQPGIPGVLFRPINGRNTELLTTLISSGGSFSYLTQYRIS